MEAVIQTLTVLTITMLVAFSVSAVFYIRKLTIVAGHKFLDRQPAVESCDLSELLYGPHTRLTREQWNNFEHLYMRMRNDDKSATDINIEPAVKRRIAEIRTKGSYLL